MKTVVITGISGTLGSALGKYYKDEGWKVIGVSRKDNIEGDYFTEYHQNQQESAEDVKKILSFDPDLILVNAGQIENEVGEKGVPLVEQFESINKINYYFPALLSLESVNYPLKKDLDIVAIGSIADGSPSCFGPVYHSSKIALHYFFSGVGPIVYYATEGKKRIRMRLYRPGAIKGPLAWAPANRLNDKGYKIRAKRVNGAPEADKVAGIIAKWIRTDKWIGTYDEPFSFRIFKYLYATFPNMHYKVQLFGWRKGSKFMDNVK